MITASKRNLVLPARRRTLPRQPGGTKAPQRIAAPIAIGLPDMTVAGAPTAAHCALAIPEVRKLIQDVLPGTDFLNSKLIGRGWYHSAQSVGMHRAQLQACRPPIRAMEPMPPDLAGLQTALIDELGLQHNLNTGRAAQKAIRSSVPQKIVLSANPHVFATVASSPRMYNANMTHLSHVAQSLGLPERTIDALLVNPLDAAFDIANARDAGLALGLSSAVAEKLSLPAWRTAVFLNLVHRGYGEGWALSSIANQDCQASEILTDMVFSRDGKRAVGISARDWSMVHIDLGADDPHWRTVEAQAGLVFHKAVIGPDGKTSVAFAEDGVYVCDLSSAVPKLARMAGSPDFIDEIYVAGRPENTLLQVNGVIGTQLMMVDFTGSEPNIRRFCVDAGGIFDAQLLADNQLLMWKDAAAVQPEEPARVRIDLSTGKSTPLDLARDLTRRSAVSQDLKWLAQAHDTHVAVYSAQHQETVELMPTDGAAVTCIEFSPDHKYVAAALAGDAYPGGVIRLWILEATSAQLQFCDAFEGTSAKFSPDGAFLATGGTDHLKLWDLRESPPEQIALPAFHSECGPATSVDFSQDGRQLAVAYLGGEAFTYDFKKLRRPGQAGKHRPLRMR